MDAGELEVALTQYHLWCQGKAKQRPDFTGADLEGANLQDAFLPGASLAGAHLDGANLKGANLANANLEAAHLRLADLRWATLSYANLRQANLEQANLEAADLRYTLLEDSILRWAHLRAADLTGAKLQGAILCQADLRYSFLRQADLRNADLAMANLEDASGLVKVMGVAPGNYYWKRFDAGLRNNGYQFRVGLNCLRPGEVFNSDERLLCSHPGFHFASRSWCALHYPGRPLEALIRIPEDAQINEPWATDGKASADKIEIIRVFDTQTGEDVTDRFRGLTDGFGRVGATARVRRRLRRGVAG